MKTLEKMSKQAEGEEQANALKEIAKIMATIGQSLIELIKYLKDKNEYQE